MGKFANLLGTVLDRFQLGLTGPLLKADSGQISARNADDTDYVALRAALVRVFGDAIELNAGAAGARSVERRVGKEWRAWVVSYVQKEATTLQFGIELTMS